MSPIAVETLGGWGPEGSALIKTLGKMIQERTGEKRSTFFLFQSISLAVQRGNAASILGTARPGEKLDEIYYLQAPQSFSGLTPLQIAARNGHSEDYFGLTPLHDAAKPSPF